MKANQGWSIQFRYMILAVVLLGFAAFVWYVRELIAPLVISALLAYVLNPIVDLATRRTPLSRRWSAVLVFGVGLLAVLSIPASLTPVLVGQARELGDDLDQIVSQIQTTFSQPVVFLFWTIHLEGFLTEISQLSTASLTPVAESALLVLESVTRNLAWILVILVSTFYLLQDWDQMRGWIVGLAPKQYQADVLRVLGEINHIWRSYLRGQLTWMLAVGIVITVALLIVGMPGGLILGILTGLFSLLPDLGPAIAALLSVAIALIEGPTYLLLSNFWFGFLVGLIYLVLINLMNIWLRPRILGRSVKLHEGLVFIAILSAVVLQGVLGALIIIPLLASVGVIGRYLRLRILGLPPFPEEEPVPENSE